MSNLTSVGISSGVPNSGTGTVSTIDALMADGGQATLGAKADAKNSATDTTAISAMSVWKQISASIQAAAASLAGTLTVGTHAVTQSGTWNVTVNAALAAGANVIGGVTAAASAFADGALVTLGSKTDAKNAATDATSVSAIGVLKQVSASVQSLVTAIGSTAWDLGAGTGGSRTQRTILDSAVQGLITCTTSVTRPADTNAYTANDVWADSTSAPTSGGFTFTNAGGVSGGAGVITDLYVMSTAVPGTLLQGELHVFDSAPTAGNDNAAWNLSDSDSLLRVAVIPFSLSPDANNSFLHAQNLDIGFTCVGSANLRFLVKVKNAYTPASAEVLSFRLKCRRAN